MIQTKLTMARHFYFLLLCFALVTFAHGDCLADKEQYDKTFNAMFPVCTAECMEKKQIYDRNFNDLFPRCKASKESEIKLPVKSLGRVICIPSGKLICIICL